ncbi:MAG: endonuclease/exonuclease/phosphatase family protein [Bacteroidales bacterium]|nr:endonuclease/exonuclease/phosphatase family protein [Bacteroidales bacterium]MBP5518041.1 endonuclease/exonuclease/phosphatase family protein [Bacteroidales bacterium]
MKRILFIAGAMLFCISGFSQKIKIVSQKAEDHVLSIMSYNIRHGAGMDRKVDLSRIAHEIAIVGPDVVALQEVDKGTERIGGVDSPVEIAKMAGGYYASFASAFDFGGGQYGNAILSKKKPLDVSSIPLPGAEEPRVMLIAEFDDFVFCSLHLSLDSASRVEACRIIAETAKTFVRLNDKPFFIAGDFNLTPKSMEMRILADNFGILSSYQFHTFPSDKPNRTLDYIMVYNGGEGKKLLKKLEKGKIGVASWVQPEAVASDHRPIFAVLFKGEDFNTVRIEE